MRCAVLVCLAAGLLTVSAFAQSAASIKTKNGYLFIWNTDKGTSMSCEIVGNKVEPKTTGDNPAFLIDGDLIQLLRVPFTNFDPERKIAANAILNAHKDWEVDYLKDIFAAPLSAKADSLKVGSRNVLVWSFTRPKYADTFDRDLYMTMAIDDFIFGLSSPVSVGDDLNGRKAKMAAITESIKISNSPFDLKKLSDEIKAEQKSVS